MDQVLVELKGKLDRNTRDANTIKLLSVIGVVIWALFPIVILYLLIYISRLSKLKNDQTLSPIFNKLHGKTTKELKSILGGSDPLEQGVSRLLLSHKSMVKVLVVIGTIVAILIGVILISHLMSWETV